MIAGLFGLGVLFGGDKDENAGPAAEPAPPVVERVARRVEHLRELRFKEIPEVHTVSPAEAREEALALLDKEYPAEQRRNDEQVLKLLGLIPPDSDLRELAGTIFSEEIAGYYDPRANRLTLVSDGDIDRITLAHELTHALEDQHFELGDEESRLDDSITANQALIEGTATVLMLDFASGRRGDRDALLGSLDLAGLFSSSSGLPPYLQRALLFPYSAGARFVDAIGTWGPANRALRSNPPLSSEQILHPGKYRAGERPLRVRVQAPPGRGWEVATSGTIGEFDTAELVRSSDSALRAERAAAGWGGGAYALWRRGSAHALTLAWRWDTRRDAAEFAAALPRYIERTLGGRRTRVAVGPVVRLAILPER